ncbi:hypothetical protein BT69DRAFT_53531 [Atractiella rhizophila]|nr:hypothetical protein BT69DRAFT_53531 [Atractiella rhizophila]
MIFTVGNSWRRILKRAQFRLGVRSFRGGLTENSFAFAFTSHIRDAARSECARSHHSLVDESWVERRHLRSRASRSPRTGSREGVGAVERESPSTVISGRLASQICMWD